MNPEARVLQSLPITSAQRRPALGTPAAPAAAMVPNRPEAVDGAQAIETPAAGDRDGERSGGVLPAEGSGSSGPPGVHDLLSRVLQELSTMQVALQQIRHLQQLVAHLPQEPPIAAATAPPLAAADPSPTGVERATPPGPPGSVPSAPDWRPPERVHAPGPWTGVEVHYRSTEQGSGRTLWFQVPPGTPAPDTTTLRNLLTDR